MSDVDIQSVLTENRLFKPGADFTAKARLKPDDLKALHQQAEEDYEGFWADQARQHMDWHTPFTTILDDSQAPHFKWFTDGTMNVSYNCIDRHLANSANKKAIIFEGEAGDTQHISYQQLHDDVCQFANALKAKGINKGDRVVDKHAVTLVNTFGF